MLDDAESSECALKHLAISGRKLPKSCYRTNPGQVFKEKNSVKRKITLKSFQMKDKEVLDFLVGVMKKNFFEAKNMKTEPVQLQFGFRK
jgi:hypothetical protein